MKHIYLILITLVGFTACKFSKTELSEVDRNSAEQISSTSSIDLVLKKFGVRIQVDKEAPNPIQSSINGNSLDKSLIIPSQQDTVVWYDEKSIDVYFDVTEEHTDQITTNSESPLVLSELSVRDNQLNYLRFETNELPGKVQALFFFKPSQEVEMEEIISEVEGGECLVNKVRYYENKVVESKGCIGEKEAFTVPVGVWMFYDETGQLIKKDCYDCVPDSVERTLYSDGKETTTEVIGFDPHFGEVGDEQ